MSLQHGKAMHVFLMLEELMGKESFKGMLKEVINTQRGQCLNQIKFMDLCSKAANQPLNWFWASNRVFQAAKSIFNQTKSYFEEGGLEI
jgi:hypothetical protein